VNVLDLLILLGIVGAAGAGYHLGFFSRVLSWAGLAGGVTLAVVYLTAVTHALGRAEPRTRFVSALAFVAGVSLAGWAIGIAGGSAVHARLTLGPRAQQADRVAGAAVGVAGVLVVVWLLIPAIASAPGWPARAARSSFIVKGVDRLAPSPPKALEELGRKVGAVGPGVLDPLADPPDAGAPPVGGLAPSVDSRVRASVVKVEGRACAEIQDGSGFAVGPDTVVTNAHVVAGERRTAVETSAGQRLGARVVAFDSGRDLAVLSVPGLGLAPLPLADGRRGDTGAVYGHPGGGPLQATPARIAERIVAVGTDIYRTSRTRRDVFVLAARLAPGDSGGPLVDQRGRVAGVAFAIDPGRPATAYALTDDELRPVIDGFDTGTGAATFDTGSCLVG
jgi:S1-C subfamily serine protease